MTTIEVGSMAEWAAAVAALASTVLSTVAVVLAAAANRTSKDALTRDDRRDRVKIGEPATGMVGHLERRNR